MLNIRLINISRLSMYIKKTFIHSQLSCCIKFPITYKSLEFSNFKILPIFKKLGSRHPVRAIFTWGTISCFIPVVQSANVPEYRTENVYVGKEATYQHKNNDDATLDHHSDGRYDQDHAEHGDDEYLQSSQLLKNASMQAVDAAIVLFHQVGEQMLDAYNEYTDAIRRLTELFKIQMSVAGNEYKEEKCWDAILSVRAEINEFKRNVDDLNLIYIAAERALDSLVESAILTDSQISSTLGAQALQTLRTYIKQAKRDFESAQLQLNSTEIEVIKSTKSTES